MRVMESRLRDRQHSEWRRHSSVLSRRDVLRATSINLRPPLARFPVNVDRDYLRVDRPRSYVDKNVFINELHPPSLLSTLLPR